MVFRFVILFCLGSLVSGQWIVSNEKNFLEHGNKLFKGYAGGGGAYGLVSPTHFTSTSGSWYAPRVLQQVAAWNPNYYHSNLYNTAILRGGSGLSSYALGGLPAYTGHSIVSMAGSPHAYGHLLAKQPAPSLDSVSLGLVGTTLQTKPAQSIQLIDRHAVLGAATPVQANVGGILLNQPSVVAVQGMRSESAELRPVTAAVHTLRRTVDYVPVPYSGEPSKTQVVHVPPNEQGIHLNFVSKSSPLTVSQQHIPGEAGQVQLTESEDEPQRLVHNVKKTVIQQINEVVQPYRLLKQEVKPVIEEAHTLVAQGNPIPLSGRTSGIIPDANVKPEFQVQQQGYTLESKYIKPVAVAQPAIAQVTVAKPETIAISQTPRVAVAAAAAPVAIAAQPAIAQVALSKPETIAVSQSPKFSVATPVEISAQPAIAQWGIAQPKLALATGGWTDRSAALGLSNVASFNYGKNVLGANQFAFSGVPSHSWGVVSHPGAHLEASKAFSVVQPAASLLTTHHTVPHSHMVHLDAPKIAAFDRKARSAKSEIRTKISRY